MLPRESSRPFEGVSGILAIGGKPIGRHESVIAFAFEIVLFEVLQEVIETTVMLLVRLLLTRLLVHNDYIGIYICFSFNQRINAQELDRRP